MILREDSILNNLPEISKRDLLILDSLRFTIEMIDYSFENLNIKIEELSVNKNKKDFNGLFLYCWNVIDNLGRFIFLCKQLPSDSSYKFLDKINHIRQIRNTYQHISERIDESLIELKRPFFGMIKWTYHNHITLKAENLIAISGIFYTDTSKFIVSEYKNDSNISDLILETVNKKGDVIEVNIFELYDEIKIIVDELDLHLANQFERLNKIDWKSKRDILLKFRGE